MRHQDQYGDACENCRLGLFADRSDQSVFDALGRDAGAQDVRSISSSSFPDPQCVAFLQEWTLKDAHGNPRLQPEVFNKAQEWLGKDGKGLADWDISRDAPYFGIPILDAPGKYFYVWLDAPVGYLASLKEHRVRRGEERRRDANLRADSGSDPETEQIHFIGKDIVYHHTLFWPAMLKFAGSRTRCRTRHRVHGFITFSGEEDVEIPRHRHQPGSCISDLGLDSGVVSLLRCG